MSRTLLEKANKLPLLPGVYIMRDAAGTVIYVGKAKKLKNRVSSYFHGDHLPKVAAMAEKVADFEVVVVNSEFEALMLENSLIKRHMPHYNILLKDDKGYPFVRLDLREKYPRFSVVNRPKEDGAQYFGPFGGRGCCRPARAASRATWGRSAPASTTSWASAPVTAARRPTRQSTAAPSNRRCWSSRARPASCERS
jgi:excinuclease UvrABC nuclease subunit